MPARSEDLSPEQREGLRRKILEIALLRFRRPPKPDDFDDRTQEARDNANGLSSRDS